MAIPETARLVASLELDDRTKKGVNSALKSIGRIDSRIGAVSGTINRNLGRAIDTGLAKAARFATDFVGAGLDSLTQLEDATTSVDAAIRQMGLTGKVTSGQVADWANEIESSVDAAFDDKDITRAASTLIRFGKVTPRNLRQSLEVMTDLAVKTGSVDSAATLLARALADPTKAAGKLSRAGIVLTKAQQKQITALVKAGKVGEAQAIILDTLAKSTSGAAKASKGEFADSQAILADTMEDAQRAIAIGFLPVITKVRDILSKELAKPETLKALRDFGKGVASGLGQLVDAAQRVPWDKVADGLRTAAGFAGKIVDIFTHLPPEAQATIIALAGLNKISGGAVTGIISELGKGLIKGVLGMTAGVVNIKAGVVNGGGGVPGGGSGGGAPAAAAGGGLKAFIAPAAVAFIAGEVGVAIQDALSGLGTAIAEGIGIPSDFATKIDQLGKGLTGLSALRTLTDLPNVIGGIPDEIGKLTDFLSGKVDFFGNPTASKPIPQSNTNDDSDRIARAVTSGLKGLDADRISTAVATATASAVGKSLEDRDARGIIQDQDADRIARATAGALATTPAISNIGNLTKSLEARDSALFDISAKLDTSQVIDMRAITAQAASSARTEAAIARLNGSVDVVGDKANTTNGKLDTLSSAVTTQGTATRTTVQQSGAATAAAAAAIKSTIASGDTRSEAAMARIQGATNSLKSATTSGLAGVKSAANATAAAIRDKDFSVTVPVTTNISIRNVQAGTKRTVTYNQRAIIP